jgi:hypothetical protein
MIKFIFYTIWVSIVSAIVSFIVVKFLLHAVIKEEIIMISSNVEKNVNQKYKNLKKDYLDNKGLKKVINNLVK